ncbi:LysR family transcriptional regulator [Microcoleus vaginatus]|uniref:LysR family transcriptional regulator n=1 Tax=Microcoleus vaginatus TaxID=119532 RepID=UPI0032AA1052
MELRHLRYFIAVADELSFSRAAQRLHIAQPPLSQQIKDLEAELGVKLFDRKTLPIQLTPAGQAFLEEARATLVQLEQAVHKTQRIDQGELGYLTVGFPSSIANGVFPEMPG